MDEDVYVIFVKEEENEILKGEKIMKSKILFFALTILLFVNYRAESYMFWNQAGSFGGSPSSYIAFPHHASINVTGSFTLEAWICPDNALIPAGQIILEKRTGTLANGYALLLNNGRVAIRTNNAIRLTGSIVVPDDAWTHVSGTYNSATNTFAIYVNNILDTSAVVTTAAPVTNVDSLRIGKGNTLNPFKGIIDELRIWRTALDGNEISRVMRTTLGSSTGAYGQLALSLTFQDDEAVGTDFSLFDWAGLNGTGKNNGVSQLDLSDRPSNTIALNDAIELDGIDDYLSGDDNPDISPATGITMEAWIFPRSVGGVRTILNKGFSPSVNYSLRINTGILIAVINGSAITLSSQTIPANQWTHVAFTYFAATGKCVFYLNGRKTGEGNISPSLITNGTDALLIGTGGTAGTFFDGYVDEVRICNYPKPPVLISNFLFTSIEQSNEPNAGLINVVYNFDGYAYDNASNGPLLSFHNGALFAGSGSVDNTPVSPLNRSDNGNFQKGFYLKNTTLRIPQTGNTGVVIDSLRIDFDTVITDINVFVALNHTAEEELEIHLISPQGQDVLLYDNEQLVQGADNIVTVFDDQADSSFGAGNKYVSFGSHIKPVNGLNSQFAGDMTAGYWKIMIIDQTGTGNGRLCAFGMQFNGAVERTPAMGIRVFMQGFYRETDSCVTDTVKMHLREDNSPYNDVGIKGDTPDDNYNFNYNFPEALLGVSYYLQVEHRNSIEIWSAHPVAFDLLSANLQYDFTVSADSAYGSNQIMVDSTPVRFAMFGGDRDQNDVVNLTDVINVYNDQAAFLTGYVPSDMTGDSTVNVSDVVITYNNSASFIQAVKP